MRIEYQDKMTELADQLATMCGDAADLMRTATQALIQGDLGLAEQVIGSEDRVKEEAAEADDRAFALLALEAPVARDLRQVVSGIHIVNDIRRMAALAQHVAKVARRRHPERAIPEEIRGYFAEMGRLAVSLAEDAQQILLDRDPAKATQLGEDDDAMDDLHRHLFTVLTVREWKHGVSPAVDIALLGRYYERFADHAVEVGRRVIFLATGELPAKTSRDSEVSSTELTEKFENHLRSSSGAE